MSSAEGTSATVGTLYGGISDARTESSQSQYRSAERTAAEVAARLDRPPASRYFWKVILLVSLGGWFEYYDLIFTGAPIAALLSSWLVPETYFGLDGWRWVVLIGSTGAIVVCFLRAGLPETPRWLAQHGRGEDALRLVEKIEQQVQHETGRPL